MAFTVSTSTTNPVQPKMGCAYVVTVILAAAAIGLLALAQKSYRTVGRADAAVVVVPALLAVALGGLTLVFHRFARGLVRASQAEAARKVQFPDQPWKWPKEWQGPAIESSNAGAAVGLWIFAVMWNAISCPGVWFFFHEKEPEKGMYFILLFPLVGLGLLWGAVYQTIRWRKYGRTRFVPSSLPGVIGGYLGGVIEVPARVVPEGEARLSLKCIRRETRGSGKNRSTSENVLWEREEGIARDKWMTGAGGTRVPVLFYIPAECAGTDASDRNNEIVWRLTAAAATAGVDFATQFTVPVFATGETAAPPEPGAPLLEEYTAQKLDDSVLKACGVRREGDTFHFSASHMPGTKITTAVLQLGILGLLVWFWGRDIPGVVWAITIFFGLIMSLFTVSVWFDKYELSIEAKDVVVTKPRPWGTKVTRMPRAEVAQVRAEKSMSSGESQYFRLSLVGTEGVDPDMPSSPGEPFAARKLRYQIEQMKKQGASTPEQLKALGGELIAQMKAQAKFVVPFASHIPGQGRAEAIGAMVLAAIRGGKS